MADLNRWVLSWPIGNALSIRDPGAARRYFSTLDFLVGSTAVGFIFVVQTLLLSISTTSSLIQKVSRFLLVGVSLIFPLGIALAILNEIKLIRGDSGNDMGNLGLIIATTVVRLLLVAIELFAALISLFCVVKYRKFFPPTFHRPLCIINGLSSIRQLFHVLLFLIFEAKLGYPISQIQFRTLAVLSVILTGWTHVACLIIAVNLLSGYFEVDGDTTSHLDEAIPHETSPLLNNNSTQGEAAAEGN